MPQRIQSERRRTAGKLTPPSSLIRLDSGNISPATWVPALANNLDCALHGLARSAAKLFFVFGNAATSLIATLLCVCHRFSFVDPLAFTILKLGCSLEEICIFELVEYLAVFPNDRDVYSFG